MVLDKFGMNLNPHRSIQVSVEPSWQVMMSLAAQLENKTVKIRLWGGVPQAVEMPTKLGPRFVGMGQVFQYLSRDMPDKTAARHNKVDKWGR